MDLARELFQEYRLSPSSAPDDKDRLSIAIHCLLQVSAQPVQLLSPADEYWFFDLNIDYPGQKAGQWGGDLD